MTMFYRGLHFMGTV